jgi:hypothetical protein
VDAPSPAVTAFVNRAEAYAELSRKLKSRRAAIPRDATPEQIQAGENELRLAIQAEREQRGEGVQGSLLSPPAAAELCAIVRRVLSGPLGDSERQAIRDENPKGQAVRANAPYPEGLQVVTMPPLLLSELPALPKEVEYRIVGSDLIVRDVQANLVVDVAPGCARAALPTPAPAATPAGKGGG